MKKFYETLKTTRAAMILLVTGIFLLAAAAVQGQSVTTDKLDYAPGETVYISGNGFMPGESVLLLIEHIEPNLPDPWHTHDAWEVDADSSGNFYSSWYVEDVELNTTLYLTAVGQVSLLTAETVFTDAINLQSITLLPTNFTLTKGTCRINYC